MASLIRLKQIESGSALQQSADIGTDFSSSVYEIIDGAGLFSSSAQVDLVNASNYDGFVIQLDMTMSSDLEASIISASISQSVALLSSTYVTTASLNILSSSLYNSDSQSLYLLNQLSSSVHTTSDNLSSSIATEFSSSYSTITSISNSFDTTIDNLSSSIATSLSASEAGQLILSSSINTTITNLSSSIVTSLSASEAGQLVLSSSINTTITNLSSSINTKFVGIETITASFEAFSQSIANTIIDTMNISGVISSSAQLDGATLRNITIAPINSDGYSLIISGALAVVNATNLQDGGFGTLDSTVPGQIWLNANQSTASQTPPPTDPSIENVATANTIDMGEF